MAVLEITTGGDGHGSVLALNGELDISTAREFERRLGDLEGAGAPVIVLDLRDLQFMDSTGLRILVAADARARAAGRRLVLVRGTQNVQRLFEITRLADRLDFVDEPAEASA